MRLFSATSMIAALVAQLSCFNVDPSTVTFSCDPKQAGNCPSNEECLAATRTCGPIKRPYVPVPVPTRACASGMGYDVSAVTGGGTSFACPVIYSQVPPRTAQQQCVNGTHVCTSADTINLVTCDAIPGAFFIANVQAHRAQDGSVACGDAGMTGIPLWSGCGADEPIAVECSGFRYAAECNLLPQGFTCTGAKIADVANSSPLSGVLCCL